MIHLVYSIQNLFRFWRPKKTEIRGFESLTACHYPEPEVINDLWYETLDTTFTTNFTFRNGKSVFLLEAPASLMVYGDTRHKDVAWPPPDLDRPAVFELNSL